MDINPGKTPTLRELEKRIEKIEALIRLSQLVEEIGDICGYPQESEQEEDPKPPVGLGF